MRSELEFKVSKIYNHELPYETKSIIYTDTKSYIPDFFVEDNIFLETKGFFRKEDRKKHVLIKKQHPDIIIIILFENSKRTIDKRSLTTYGEWCTKNNIPWFCMKTTKIPSTKEELINDTYRQINSFRRRKTSKD